MDLQALSPTMRQYLETKQLNPDAILMFRMGDFYEMFFEDAVTVSRELDLVLTGKSCGTDEKAPMCGVPFHSVDIYIGRLVAKGYKVSVCEQFKKPGTDIVEKREIVRTITPGTVTEPSMLNEKQNRYISGIFISRKIATVCFIDVSTYEVIFTDAYNVNDFRFYSELIRFSPSEIYTNQKEDLPEMIKKYLVFNRCCLVSGPKTVLDREYYRDITLRHFNNDLAACSIKNNEDRLVCFGFILEYLYETQKNDLKELSSIDIMGSSEYMEIDASTWRNLEITENSRTREKKGSLLGVIDKTNTAMGSRSLIRALEKPLNSAAEITRRHKAVSALLDHSLERSELISHLKNVRDVERLIAKISFGTITPREFVSLRDTLLEFAEIKRILPYFSSGLIQDINEKINSLDDLSGLIGKMIVDQDIPNNTREGGYIAEGYNSEVDELRALSKDSKKVLMEIETREREKTGIPKLKISYNKVFGYYIEVSNSFLNLVPQEYERKQTLVNGERFITSELKELETKLLTAGERLISLELELYEPLVKFANDRTADILRSAGAIGLLDMLVSFAEVSVENNYVCPVMTAGDAISIKNGRHPVVESLFREELFVPNDTYLNTTTNRMAVITGPNMAGKSTYMRQVAIITLMAHIGCFVPASSAEICLVDKIFTRVGASDDIASGQSTFMIEMNEVAYIIKNATKRSLLIFDEIGRGTSTFDGMSIAQAVLEYVCTKISAKSLFATHYHELTSMSGKLSGVNNYNIAARKKGKDIVFLRKILEGGTDDSYGIEVARLAGVPDEITNRAKEILNSLESPASVTKSDSGSETEDFQFTLTSDNSSVIINKLKETDITVMTPLEAMNVLYDLINKAKEL